MWILIVIGISVGGFGFSQEFVNRDACINASQNIQAAVQKAVAYAYCVPKEK